MENQVKVLFESELAEWKELLHACGITYRVTNLSDYTGFEALIEWAE